MKGERVISKGNIITFSYLFLECCGGGQGRRGNAEEHLKVITIPEVYLLFLFTLSPVFTSLHAALFTQPLIFKRKKLPRNQDGSEIQMETNEKRKMSVIRGWAK